MLNGGNGFYCLSHAQIQKTPSGGRTYVDVLRELFFWCYYTHGVGEQAAEEVGGNNLGGCHLA